MKHRLDDLTLNAGIDKAERYKIKGGDYYIRTSCSDCHEVFYLYETEIPYSGCCSKCGNIIQIEWYYDWRTHEIITPNKTRAPENPDATIGRIIIESSTTFRG